VARTEKTFRSDQKDATREQLLEAASKLLSEFGYAAFRVAAVAKEAGVSLGGMLHHFPTKDSLVIAVLERLSARVLEQAMHDVSNVPENADPFQAIAASAQRFYAAPEFLTYLDIFLSVRRHTLVGDVAITLLPAQRAAMEELWLPQFRRIGISEMNGLLIIRTLWAVSRGLAVTSGTEPGRFHEHPTIDFVIASLKHTHLKPIDSE
jgi:AcrR family transcriptional regulator